MVAAKQAGALRTIGELADETGIAQHVLRYWERNVPALKPLRRAGRRYYRPEDAALVRRLHHLVSVEGYTLEGAARAVRGSGPAPEPAVPLAVAPIMQAAPPTQAIAPADWDRLRTLRDRLAAALNA
jgi:DNA-binding transcriptional MerR regulator